MTWQAFMSMIQACFPVYFRTYSGEAAKWRFPNLESDLCLIFRSHKRKMYSRCIWMSRRQTVRAQGHSEHKHIVCLQSASGLCVLNGFCCSLMSAQGLLKLQRLDQNFSHARNPSDRPRASWSFRWLIRHCEPNSNCTLNSNQSGK